MDRVTELQQSLLSLLSSTHQSFDTLSKQAPQRLTEGTGGGFPIVKPEREDGVVGAADEEMSEEEFEELQQSLIVDFIQKAKTVEFLIDWMPEAVSTGSQEGSEGSYELKLRTLQQEMLEANEEYKQVLGEAEELNERMKQTLENVMEEALPLPGRR